LQWLHDTGHRDPALDRLAAAAMAPR
jgi:hypothetical protein